MQEPILKQRKKEGGRGQALVEFALVLPIILLIFTGIIDFGRMMFMYSQLTNAVREGARYGSVSGPDANNPQFANCVGISNMVKNTLAVPIAASDLTISIAYDDGKNLASYTCPTTSTKMSDFDDIELGDRVRVTARARFAFITPIVSSFGPMNLQVTSARTILRGGTQVTGD